MTEQDEATPPRSSAGRPAEGSLVGLGIGLARLYGATWFRAAGWSVRIARQAFAVAETRTREVGFSRGTGNGYGEGGATASDASLRERGAELLRQSADVRFADDTHPAYERILGDLAPDEGRILRLLASQGPQPAVDVRTARPLGIGSRLVAPGLSMIAAQAGCRHRDRTHAYLNNLYRLGLIWFSRERLEDPRRYQVLEAQPDVVAAMREAGRATTVRRSIHLTPFGVDFCQRSLPLDPSGVS